MLVEEAHVEVQDAIADDVEAEVPRFDHARVDRADRDLVGVGSGDRHRPAREVGRVLDQRAQRLVAVEGDALQVVRLALGPLRRRREVDDARCASVLRRRRSRFATPRRAGTAPRAPRAARRPCSRRDWPGARRSRAPRPRERDTRRRGTARSFTRALARARPRLPIRAAQGRGRRARGAARGSRPPAPRPAGGRPGRRARAAAPPCDGLDERVAEAEEAEREQHQGDDHGRRVAGLDPADRDHQLGDEQRRRREAGQRRQAQADDGALCDRRARATPRAACDAVDGCTPSSGSAA